MNVSRWGTWLLCLLLGPFLGWSLTGCQDEEGPRPQPAPTQASGTASPSESGSATPTVEPADGKQLGVRSFSVRLPDGWIVVDEGRVFASGADTRSMTGGVNLADLELTFGDNDLDAAAARARKDAGRGGPTPKRLPNLTLDGVEGYVIAGPAGMHDYVWEYGTTHNGGAIRIQFSFGGGPERIGKDRALEAVDAVMASWTWR